MPSTDWIDTLKKHDVTLSGDQIQQITQYCFLVRSWSDFASLVSVGNLEHLEELHIVDSLSLLKPVTVTVPEGGLLFDIGSGGGFPAIPLAIALPERNFLLMERSGKKISFLQKVIGALKLKHVSLIHGSFPERLPEDAPHAITARAVERADTVLMDITDSMPENTVFLCQSGDPRGKIDGAMFHVEHWKDNWTKSGARRGSLYTIRHREDETVGK